jgi:gluconolactonase
MRYLSIFSVVVGILFSITSGKSNAQDFPGAGKVTKIHGGFKFTEGPAYDGRHLYFTDIPNNRIMRTDLKGNLETFFEPSGSCNGLMFDGNNLLVACRMGRRESPAAEAELIAINVDSKQVRSLAASFNGKKMNACNDLVIDRKGGVYFTDPRFGAPDPWPQGKEAFYYRSAKGEITRLGDDLSAPNGIILSPDESTLYLVASMQKQVHAYSVVSPGVISNRRVLFEIKQPSQKENSGGDGLSVDVRGNLYITTDLGVQVVAPDGKLLGIVTFPEQPANCAFGGREGKTLFATCRTGLYAVDMPYPGHKFTGKIE